MVNDSFARARWPNESPLGRRLDLAMQGGGPAPPPANLHPDAHTTINPWTDNTRFCTVVGVVGSIRERGLTDAVQERVHFPFLQRPSGTATLIVRTSGDPLNHADATGGLIRRLIPAHRNGSPRIALVADDMRRSVAQPAFYMWLFGALAVMAIVLAVTGVLGMTWQAVGLRTHEIGVRLALGARPDQVVSLFLRTEGLPVVIGALLGIGGAAATTRYMASLLHEVTPWDPVAFLLAPSVVTIAALGAILVPALRARGVDPTVLLRAQ